MSLPSLVAICSPSMASGKTEIAKHLAGTYSRFKAGTEHLKRKEVENVKDYHLLKFATPLKAMATAMLSCAYDQQVVREMLEGSLKEVELPLLCNVTPRRVMQTLGTEWGRDTIHKDLWTQLAMAAVDKALAEKAYIRPHDPARVVLDDLRFLNEYDAVVSRGGMVIRVVRPGAPPYLRHASEGELDELDILTVTNDGTIPQLLAKVDALLGRNQNDG
jgi:hypothetical protein